MVSLNFLGLAFNLWDLLKYLIGFVIAVAGYLFIIHKIIKINWKLAKNLNRKLLIFCPAGGKRSDGQPINMEKELDVLRRSGLFRIPSEVIKDFNNLDEDEVKNCGLVILGYHGGMKNFNDLVEMVKRNGKPLIIYTFELGLNLDDKDLKILRPYKWYSLSSMPLRLVSDIFATMASFDYGQHKS